MNDIETLRDAVIAEEIMQIQVMSQEDLVRELVSVRSEHIESLSPDELMAYLQNKRHGNES